MEEEKTRQANLFNKVPEVTFFFWIIKVLCTTVGETFADFLNVNLNFGLTDTSVVMGILLIISLVLQFRSKKYVPVIYWITVVFISVFGTLVTDNLTDKYAVPLETSTIIFFILLLATFTLWYSKEKTLSIHSIYTKRREMFYWLAVLFTFALGTAAGDLMAESLGLGYLITGIIVAVIIFIVAVAAKLKLNSVLSFWIIYIMTRPLGASIGDLLSQPTKFGGLGLGATLTSIIFLAGIFLIILYFTFSKKRNTANEIVQPREDETGKKFIWQSVVTIAIFIIAGVSAYAWRQNALQKEVKQESPTTSSVNNTVVMPVDDFSAFKIIAADTRKLVDANDLAGAKIRVDDLEYEWDNAQSKLKPKYKSKWTEIDDAIDKVLRQLRAVRPVQQDCRTALDQLLSMMK